jgi:hypothetical protein
MTRLPWPELAARDDVVLIVSHPIGSGAQPAAGSVPAPCVECGKPVWLAPVSQAALAGPPPGIVQVFVACLACALEHVPDVLRERPSVLPGQAEEVARELMRRSRKSSRAGLN